MLNWGEGCVSKMWRPRAGQQEWFLAGEHSNAPSSFSPWRVGCCVSAHRDRWGWGCPSWGAGREVGSVCICWGALPMEFRIRWRVWNWGVSPRLWSLHPKASPPSPCPSRQAVHPSRTALHALLCLL